MGDRMQRLKGKAKEAVSRGGDPIEERSSPTRSEDDVEGEAKPPAPGEAKAS